MEINHSYKSKIKKENYIIKINYIQEEAKFIKFIIELKRINNGNNRNTNETYKSEYDFEYLLSKIKQFSEIQPFSEKVPIFKQCIQDNIDNNKLIIYDPFDEVIYTKRELPKVYNQNNKINQSNQIIQNYKN